MTFDDASGLLAAIELLLNKVDPDNPHHLRVVPAEYFVRLDRRERRRKARLKLERIKNWAAIEILKAHLENARCDALSMKQERDSLEKQLKEAILANDGIRFMPRDEEGVIASLRNDNENLHRENNHLARRNRELDSRLSMGVRSA